MDIKKMAEALNILIPHTHESELFPINRNAGGAYGRASQAAISVNVGWDNRLTDAEKQRLSELGWRPEQDGEYYVYVE